MKRKSSPSDDLFELIKSMSKSEKRHFRMHSHAAEDAVYIRLFELIDKQSEYNEAEIKNALSDTDAIRHFHVAKKYLFEMIMRSLTLYHSHLSPEFRLKEVLQQIEICNSKGLFKLAYKLLKNAEKSADKYELFNLRLEVLTLKRENIMSRVFSGYTENDLAIINTKEKESVRKIKNIAVYKSLLNELMMEYVKWAGIKSPEQNKVFKKIETHPMFLDETKADSFQAKWILYAIKGYYYHENGLYDQSLKYRKKSLDLIEENQTFIKSYRRNYLVAMHNYINDLRLTGQFKLIETEAEKYREFPTKSFHEKAEQFRRYYLMKFQLLAETGNYQQYKVYEQQFLNTLPVYSKSISRPIEMLIKFYIARCCHGTKEYEKTLEYLIEITTESQTRQSIETIGMAHLWMMIAHFDMGNFSILPYLASTAGLFYSKNQLLQEADTILFRFFRSKSLNTPERRRISLEKMKKQLSEALTNNKTKSNTYKPILQWADTKIKNKKSGNTTKKTQ
jgi:tetratricopeptide (TPR) repeat protein